MEQTTNPNAKSQNPNALVLGVTGHRVLAELEKINAGIDAALEHIQKIFPNRPFTVLSPLAEGADRLVADRILAQPNAQLIAVLPMPRTEYETDFDDESRQEFLSFLKRAQQIVELPPAPTREAAYEACGLYVLNHCDILIAIWDGQPAQGVGGTGAIVAAAREIKKPLVWIHAGNRKLGTMEATTLGEEQGTVTYENLDETTLLIRR